MTTATAIHPLMKDQNITPEQELVGLNDLRNHLQYGDFVSAPLVTDTTVYEVVKVTKRTATLRATSYGERMYADESCDVAGYGLGVLWHEVVSDPAAGTKTVRITKDGVIKNGNYARAGQFSKCMLVNGAPVKRVDYRL